MRRFVTLMATAVLIGLAGVVTWAGLTHRVSYVVTNGVSMQPLYHAGDLVVVARRDSYRRGDIVAYRVGRVTLLHRVIDGDAGGWVTKGDNNRSIDPARPTTGELLGRAVLHVPAGGVWIRRAISVPVLGVIAFLLIAGAGGAVRYRRGNKRGPMGKHVSVSGVTGGLGLFRAVSAPRLRPLAGAVAVVGLLGAALGVMAWTRPAMNTVSVKQPPARTMTFSYSTTVPLTPAYDGTVVRSPEPVFRKVTDEVEIAFDYTGPPGRVTVDAELSTVGGWHSTVPLVGEVQFTASTYRGVVRLDLATLAARADAGGQAIGVRAGEVNVSVVPRITGVDGASFAPALKLKLTPLALTADGPFAATDKAPAAAKRLVPKTIGVAGRPVVGVPTARVVSSVLVFGALLATAVLFLVARRAQPVPESETIRRRYRQLLVEVRPMAPPAGRPVVDVTEFKTLARLAERYGLLVLHCSEERVATFAVHDDSVTYRYRTDAADAHVAEGQAIDEQAQAPQHSAAAVVTEAPTTAVDVPPHWQLMLPGGQDGLTHLANGSLFESEVQYAIDAGSVDPQLCLMLIGIDDFDAFNESNGRASGDFVLVAIAERLRRTVRPTDLVARLDDDNFAVLFENIGPAAVDSVAKRVMRNVNESVVVDGQQFRVQASLGIAQASDSDDAATMMAHAAAALAEARIEAREQVAWFAPAQGHE